MMSKLRIQKKVYETVDGKENLSKKYNKQFVWKFPATSRGKGVADGVGGNVKSTVHCYVMSKKKKSIIVQDCESFVNALQEI